jgi:hypothetical protein
LIQRLLGHEMLKANGVALIAANALKLGQKLGQAKKLQSGFEAFAPADPLSARQDLRGLRERAIGLARFHGPVRRPVPQTARPLAGRES